MSAMANMENLVGPYTTTQYELVGHALTIGYAAQAAGFVYFFMMIFARMYTHKKHVQSTIYGMLVMTSAFLLLYSQWKAWDDCFEEKNGLYVPVEGKSFSNGYRYLNWSIDVPLLLLQLVLVSDIDMGNGIFNVNTRVASSGLAMIYVGYIGQFFENKDKPGMLIGMGIVGCVFYLIMLAIVLRCLGEARRNLPNNCGVKVTLIGIIYVVFWTIYPISYFMPVISYTASGVVVRQFIYTIADVVSKVIYGVILCQISISVASTETRSEKQPLMGGLGSDTVQVA